MVHDKTLVHGKNIMYYAIQKKHSLSWHQQLTSELSELFWLRYVIIIGHFLSHALQQGVQKKKNS